MFAMRRISLLLAALVALSAFAAPLVAAPKGTSHNQSDIQTAECANDNTLVTRAPATLWPPNHKYYTDLYVLAQDGEGGEVELVTRGWHDQYDGDVEYRGAGNTGDDITINDDDATAVTLGSEDEGKEEGKVTVVATEDGMGEVQTDWKARAERAGSFKEGRTYTLDALASYSDGSTCELRVDFIVPHDMRKANRDA
jgi:hypothetical protein